MPWWDKMLRRRSLQPGDSPRFEADLQVRAQHLNKILERERTRADRTGRPLSMVLIGYDGRSRKRQDAAIIVHVMQHRARITDDVGWFDKDTGFAVLPDTPVEGGRRFAGIVCRQLRERGIKTSFAIYQYAPLRRSDNDDWGRGGGHRLPRETAPNGHERRQREPVHAVAATTGRDDGEAVHELQPLMAEGLPWWKRTTDLLVAGGALALCWPLLVGVGLAVKLDSPGPAIFKQQRAGLGGKPFGIWKFRTMRRDAEQLRDQLLAVNEQDGPAFKIRQDPRVTRLGAFLRKTSLDELPQLVNVLLGDMTLVGPRPLPIKESDACEPWQKYRLDVTPGLTCIWQVWGRSTVSFSDWVRMDLQYRRRRTPRHDLKIMLATVPAVLKQRGAC